MLFQVGGQGSRPTFFEMAAAQQLPASLRAALTYSIGVLALRRPFLHKLLDFEDESFALLMLVLESHTLRTTDASFSESLYGLRRRPANIALKNDDATTTTTSSSALRRRQRVVLPYLKSKLHSIYNREREARLQATLWGDETQGFDDGRGDYSPVSTLTSDAAASISMRIANRVQRIVGFCYPWLHASTEGLQFAYQLLYLLDATGYYSLALHALGIHVCRATGQELMDTSSRISKMRNRERERLRGPQWLKMMEWWYQSAEERMSAPTVYPPPPPPPPPKYKRCPITLMPSTVDQIRRLFHDV
ncbi:hypothetical protein JHK85_008716 [Glycine max]|nr:hypothetical protein JHK85_008716 [Glycine max]